MPGMTDTSKPTPAPVGAAGVGKRVDWEAVEAAYRVGTPSIRAIALNHGCSDTAIRKKAKECGWSRDLSAKVNAKADELVRMAEVRSQVRTETPTEREQVEVTASIRAAAILSERKDVARYRGLAIALFEELESQTVSRELYANLGEMLLAPDDKGMDKLNELYIKVTSTPSRVDSTKKLADTLKTLIELERKVLNIKEDAPPDANKGIADAIDGLSVKLDFEAIRKKIARTE